MCELRLQCDISGPKSKSRGNSGGRELPCGVCVTWRRCRQGWSLRRDDLLRTHQRGIGARQSEYEVGIRLAKRVRNDVHMGFESLGVLRAEIREVGAGFHGDV